ncbi:MAG: substrate-binding domain-containing protein, partial [Lachnospiraceae bacterium]|nr:substrate-binding domain-containing protein [Lachnospiraceae bacterium]
MKKMIAIILCIVLTLTMIGCSGGAANTDTADANTEREDSAKDAAENKTEDTTEGSSEDAAGNTAAEEVSTDPVKLGVIFYSKDDSLGQLVYSYLNYAAEVIDNLEIQWVFGSYDAASQVADAENLIAAGVDGIMCLTLDDLAMQQIANLCNENEVYFQVMFRMPSEEETKAVLDTYEYYVGYAIEDTENTSYETVRIMADRGIGKIGVGGNTHSATSTLRMNGMEKGCEDFNIDVLAQFDLGNDVSSIQSDVQNILDSYSDVEAIWLMSGSLGIADITVNTLKAHQDATGKTVGVVTFDTFEGMAAAFEDDILWGAVGGQAPLCLQAFAALYNAVDGHPLSDEKVSLLFPFLVLTDSDDLDLFEQYYNNTEVQIYDEELIKSMLYRYNPD